MTTPKKIAANKRNAKRSTGPKTAAGKTTSSRNAHSHGLSSGFSVLPHEDQAAFDKLRTNYREELKPQGAREDFLVDQITQSEWRLNRTRRFEELALEQLINDGAYDESNPDAKIVAKLGEKSPNIIDLLHRYAKSAEQSYYRAQRELNQGRARNERNEDAATSAWLEQQMACSTYRYEPFTAGLPDPPAIDENSHYAAASPISNPANERNPA